MATTMKNNLIDPEVLGAYLDVKLVDAIKLAPLVEVDNTLVGRPGSTLSLPKFAYIGDADVVAEGAAMDPVALTADVEEVEIFYFNPLFCKGEEGFAIIYSQQELFTMVLSEEEYKIFKKLKLRHKKEVVEDESKNG